MQFPDTARAVALALFALTPAATLADAYAITVDPIRIETQGFVKTGIGYNGAQTPTVLRFKEGEDVVIAVTNNLAEDTSIHWHGLILPFEQDGVPGISYAGIKPGQTFTYRFPIRQSGTYWFHSHTGFQEPDGAYGAIVIEPQGREPYRYDRDHVVQFTDKHPHSGGRVFRNLKLSADYYNREQRTLFDLLSDAGEQGLGTALSDRAAWGGMRMMPTDIEDVQGFAPMINGADPTANWTGIFKPGERVRLRLINSSAMTYFDVRIPGLKMTVVAADGIDVAPVQVDELRIAVAETYDVIVRPTEDRAYSILGESMGRTAMARATLAPREGMSEDIPALRPAPRLTMADMGMMEGMDHSGMAGMDHSAMGGASHAMPDGTMMKGADHAGMAGMDHSAMGSGASHPMPDGTMMKGADHAGMAGMDHSAMGSGASHAMPDGTMMKGMDRSAMGGGDPFYAPGSGLTPRAAEPGGKFLSYADLQARVPLYPDREATREIELRLTGAMERYIWSINGVKYEDAEPIRLQYGERVRFKFVNETMMTHPMHLHGMWSIIDNGTGARDPIKHTVSVAPGTTLHTETEVDAPGQWAFHCHLSYHMAGGMFRKVIVEGGPDAAAVSVPAPKEG